MNKDLHKSNSNSTSPSLKGRGLGGESVVPGSKSTLAILRWFLRIFRQVKLQALINAVSGILRVALDFAFIWATKQAIDAATSSTHVTTSSLLHIHFSLFDAGLVLVLIMLAQLALGYAGRWIAALLGVGAQNRMQRHIFDHLLRSEWRGIEARHSGDTLNRLVTDTSTVVHVVTDTVPQALAVVVRLVAAFFFLFAMDATLALVVVVILPLFIALSKLYVNRMRAITREVRQTDSRIQSTLQESLQHRMVIKTLERMQTISDMLAGEQAQLRHQVRRRTLFSTTSNLVLNVGFGAAYLFTFLWSAYQLSLGVITFGMMTAFIQLCGQIQGPFRELTRFIPAIISSFTAAERLMELEEMPLEEEGQPIRFADGVGIRFDHVDFAYDLRKRPVLCGASYDFPPGSTTAILGETGAGKTTLVRLILALIQPDRGRVELYGTDGRTATASAQTRCNLVYVPQGNTLFSGTLRWNLQMGNPQATDAEMRRALRLACADFVASLPGGLDTRIGEGGTGLSEGQAQRIAIARALLRSGSVLLLDEATSALDQDTEQRLLQNLIGYHQTLSVKPTLICITHRPAVVAHCTQTIVLERQEG
ncbi:MAG: ABC transporter ATP-binding protein [Bacteroidaceae bacterium]|nr:ABC transporter ATP-binding protein [Bacteroidaceae bacterium]